MSKPTSEGYYWAKWLAIGPDTEAGHETSGRWEIVEVFRDLPEDKAFGVFIPGVNKSQPVDVFEWGGKVAGRYVNPLRRKEEYEFLLALVDACYQKFLEDPNGVPSTKWANHIITEVEKNWAQTRSTDADFEAWWAKDGRYLDPDPQVDWFDKRQEFAALAFYAGRRQQ